MEQKLSCSFHLYLSNPGKTEGFAKIQGVGSKREKLQILLMQVQKQQFSLLPNIIITWKASCIREALPSGEIKQHQLQKGVSCSSLLEQSLISLKTCSLRHAKLLCVSTPRQISLDIIDYEVINDELSAYHRHLGSKWAIKKKKKEKSISALQNKQISNQFYTAKLENVQPVKPVHFELYSPVSLSHRTELFLLHSISFVSITCSTEWRSQQSFEKWSYHQTKKHAKCFRVNSVSTCIQGIDGMHNSAFISTFVLTEQFHFGLLPKKRPFLDCKSGSYQVIPIPSTSQKSFQVTRIFYIKQ